MATTATAKQTETLRFENLSYLTNKHIVPTSPADWYVGKIVTIVLADGSTRAYRVGSKPLLFSGRTLLTELGAPGVLLRRFHPYYNADDEETWMWVASAKDPGDTWVTLPKTYYNPKTGTVKVDGRDVEVKAVYKGAHLSGRVESADEFFLEKDTEEVLSLMKDDAERAKAKNIPGATFWHATTRKNWAEGIHAEDGLMVHVGSKDAALARINNGEFGGDILRQGTPYYLHEVRIKPEVATCPQFMMDLDSVWADRHSEKWHGSYDCFPYINAYEDAGSLSMYVLGSMVEVVSTQTAKTKFISGDHNRMSDLTVDIAW